MYILIKSHGRYDDHTTENIAVSSDRSKLEALAEQRRADDLLSVSIREEIDVRHKHLEVDCPFTVKPPKPIKQLGSKKHKEAVNKYNVAYDKWRRELIQRAEEEVLKEHGLRRNFLDNYYDNDYTIDEVEEL